MGRIVLVPTHEDPRHFREQIVGPQGLQVAVAKGDVELPLVPTAFRLCSGWLHLARDAPPLLR